MMPNLCPIQGGKAQELIPNWPGVSGSVWVNYIVYFLFETFDNGYNIEPWIIKDLLFQHIMSTLMVSLWEIIQKFALWW